MYILTTTARLFLLITLILFINPIYCDLIFSDKFQTCSSSWITSGSSIKCPMPHSGHCTEANSNSKACIGIVGSTGYIQRVISTQNYDNIVFKYSISTYLFSYEWCKVYYSPDSGNNWNELESYNYDIYPSPPIINETHNLPSDADNNPNFAVRFRQSAGGGSECVIDDVYIEGTYTTNAPTENPSKFPTKFPTFVPTFQPTNPTRIPTRFPTKYPTEIPTVSPTNIPTVFPTKSPTKNPTQNPSQTPTEMPTISPTNIPTVTPTQNPTVTPTMFPTQNPTVTPTMNPTKNPTISPTTVPTTTPTKNPSENPTVSPTKNQTISPTNIPTATPTKVNNLEVNDRQTTDSTDGNNGGFGSDNGGLIFTNPKMYLIVYITACVMLCVCFIAICFGVWKLKKYESTPTGTAQVQMETIKTDGNQDHALPLSKVSSVSIDSGAKVQTFNDSNPLIENGDGAILHMTKGLSFNDTPITPIGPVTIPRLPTESETVQQDLGETDEDDDCDGLYDQNMGSTPNDDELYVKGHVTDGNITEQ